jgi:hypothetical protein
MSGLRRSARSKAAQPENTLKIRIPPTLDVGRAVTAKSQPTGSKANGKGQHAAPKAKAVPESTAASFHAPEIETEAEPEPPSSTQSAPHKRGRPKGQGTSKDPLAQVVEPVEKKQKVDAQPAPENPPTKTKKPIPPRSPLPQRINRVIHPGRPAMPRPKHTSAEVAEAKAKKAELLQRLEELDKQKKIALAEMELDEEEEDMEEERTAVQHRNDLQDAESEVEQKNIQLLEMELDEDEDMEERTAVRHLNDLLQDAESEEVVPVPKDGGLEDFPMDGDESQDDEDESLDTEDGDSEPKSVKTKSVSVCALKPSFITNQDRKTKKKKKAVRGETREAVEAEKTRLRQERQKLKRRADKEDNRA